jgi:hypothetical protein
VVRTAVGLQILAAHPGTVWPLIAVDAPGWQVLLVSAGIDGIRVWDAATGEPVPCRNSTHAFDLKLR